MKIAIAGKGGSGKTTIASNLARYCLARGFNVYAVDADPDGSLGAALGLRGAALSGVRPIIEMSEFIGESGADGSLYLRRPDIGELSGCFSADIGGVKFLRMGAVKPAGSSCYCAEHNFLHALVNSLLLGDRDIAVFDMSAGVEHLVRGTVKGADAMIVASEPSRASVESARHIQSLGEQLGIGGIWHVCNKIRNEKEALFARANFAKARTLGLVRFSERIADGALRLADSAPAARASASAGASASAFAPAGASAPAAASAAAFATASAPAPASATAAEGGGAELELDSPDMAPIFAKLLDGAM
ncbi:MAG: AAA family ATPase [Clostridiales bacterium]|jgi:CO dehydrogenase maturation factor|nr:AAA family ATPase [Clostridiales bacterium]